MKDIRTREALLELHPEYEQLEQDGLVDIESIINYPLDKLAIKEQKNLQKMENNYARGYLASTDWYASRLAENGTAIPADVLEKREAARAAIVD